jgi:hypothetical protein
MWLASLWDAENPNFFHAIFVQNPLDLACVCEYLFSVHKSDYLGLVKCFFGRQQRLTKETERLVKEVKKELDELGMQVRRNRNVKLLRSYQELLRVLE